MAPADHPHARARPAAAAHTGAASRLGPWPRHSNAAAAAGLACGSQSKLLTISSSGRADAQDLEPIGAVSPAALAAGSPIATLAQSLADSGITASGYVAASYYYSSGTHTYDEFDIHSDSLQLDQAGLTLGYRPMTHNGIRATYALGFAVSLIVGANSGWNVTVVGSHANTGEFGVALAPVGDFELRLEGRYDTSNVASFIVSTGPRAGGGTFTERSDHQSEVAAQGVCEF